ncbi:MAG: Arm DNA-binding domain-containing protein, partial [Candidatus Latescibacterota bacterium]|nr:Arm DNA-binding domain-containing protein [Candidatus Latescibacterota bacterium]
MLDFPGIHRSMGVCGRGISVSSPGDAPMVDRTLNKLTAAQVKAASFADRGKAHKLRDGGGLYLLVNEQGKYWRWRYYWGQNDRGNPRERTLALGVYPDVTLAAACEECSRARALHSQGVEPNVHRRATQGSSIASFEMTFK